MPMWVLLLIISCALFFVFDRVERNPEYSHNTTDALFFAMFGTAVAGLICLLLGI